MSLHEPANVRCLVEKPFTSPWIHETRMPDVAEPTPADDVRARLAAIVESSDDAIISKDLDGSVTSWNQAAERMFGYRAAEIVGKSIRVIIPADRQNEEDDVLRRIRKGEKVDHFETVRRRKDGSAIAVSLTVSPIHGSDGRVIGASKIARDITEQQRSRERNAILSEVGAVLASSLDYHATLTNIARAAAASFVDYCVIDLMESDGALRRVATAHRVPERQTILEQARRYTPPHRSPIARPLRTGQPVLLTAVTLHDIDAMTVDDDHKRVMLALGPRSLITVPLIAHGRAFGILTLVRTEGSPAFDEADCDLGLELARRTALAADTARMYDELVQAVRTRDEVLAVVSHDLRNGLGTILTAARLLLESSADGPRRTRRLETIARTCAGLNRLMQDLLDVARLEAGQGLTLERQPHDASALLREGCELLTHQAEDKSIEFECEVGAELGAVSVDRDRFLQVLSNIIGNAVKFTPEGGRISVKAERIADSIQVSISDTGPGIKPEDLERIFESYWQAARTARLGTGLGLPIAKGIVEAHEGRIWANSRPGFGSTFHFTLPLARRGKEGANATDTVRSP
jgi:PAS domain S-box-containing protein